MGSGGLGCGLGIKLISRDKINETLGRFKNSKLKICNHDLKISIHEREIRIRDLEWWFRESQNSKNKTGNVKWIECFNLF